MRDDEHTSIVKNIFVLPASVQSSSTIYRARLRPADDLSTAQWGCPYTRSLLKELKGQLYKSVDELTASQLCLLSKETKQMWYLMTPSHFSHSP